MGKRSSIIAESKQVERNVAEFLGGRRLHAGEWQGPGDVDVIADRFIAQVKHRANVPSYILEGLRQIHEAREAQEELRRLQPTITDFPIPLAVIRTKPGRGREGHTFFVLDQECFNRLASAWVLLP